MMHWQPLSWRTMGRETRTAVPFVVDCGTRDQDGSPLRGVSLAGVALTVHLMAELAWPQARQKLDNLVGGMIDRWEDRLRALEGGDLGGADSGDDWE